MDQPMNEAAPTPSEAPEGAAPDAAATPPDDGAMEQKQEALRRVVMAGMKLMYDPKIFPTFKEGFKDDKPIGFILSAQAAGLIKILDDKAQGKIPRSVLIPAGIMLLLEMASFMVEAGIAKPTKEDIQKAIQAFIALILKTYGVLDAGKQQPGPQEGTPPPQQPAAGQPVPQQPPMAPQGAGLMAS